MSDLEPKARNFASETSKLLNATVTNGLRITYAFLPDRTVALGLGVGKKNLVPNLIPLARNKASANLYLYLAHTLDLDDQQQHLTAHSTTYSVQVGPDPDATPLCSFDYTRNPANKYPGTHMHVYSAAYETSGLFAKLGTPKRQMADLHLPVGGKRYRPCLEDILEFLILDELVIPQRGWEEAIAAGRERWFERQLGAAVRRNPEVARAQLAELDQG